jgi:hypothetical protein
LITNQILTTIATFFSFREVVTQIYLSFYFLIDLLFISYGILKFSIRFKALEIILIIFILASTFKILVANSLPLSRRTITDIINPLFFIFKISIFRSIVYNDKQIINSFIRKSSTLFLASTVLTVLLFFAMSKIGVIYIGLTPPIEVPYINSLFNGGIISVLISLSLIILSGKRSILIAAVLCFLYYHFFLKQKNRLIKLALLTIAIILSITIFPLIMNSKNAALEKYVYTIQTIIESDIDLNDEESIKILDVVSAGRIAEILSSTNNSSTIDILFGKGPGYTYKYYGLNTEEENLGYSNVHFTPVNFLTKYGLFFTFFIFYYILSTIFTYKSVGDYRKLVTLILLMYLIEMFFAFNIFVEPLIPLCLGYLTARTQKTNLR